MNSGSGHVSTPRQLMTYLRVAARRNECCKVLCTTCGGLPFLKGVMRTIGCSFVMTRPMSLSDETAIQLTDELKLLDPAPIDHADIEPYVRFLVCQIEYSLGVNFLSERLKGSWAGLVLESMIDHHARLVLNRDMRAKTDKKTRSRLRDAKAMRLAIRDDAKARRDTEYRRGR